MNDIDETIKQELAADGSNSGIEEELHDPYPFDSEKISISPKRISLSNVLRRLDRGLIHAADIQRNPNLWNHVKQSRLIESLMLKIPLPLFYAAENKDDQLFIIDGLQRISTIKEFVLKKSFKLESLEFLNKFDGKRYDEIPERMQIRINETELDFAIIGPDSPPEIHRNIFKRLNTGGLPLNEQEIRHALYNGPVTDLLARLAVTNEFNDAVANSVNDSRMAAQELIIRFLSFLMLGVNEYKKDEEMDLYLSDSMQIFNKLISPDSYSGNKIMLSRDRKINNNDINDMEQKFLSAMLRARELFDNCAFRVTTPAKIKTGRWRSPINKSLFETWSVLLSKMSDADFTELLQKKELLYQSIDDLFESSPMIGNFFGRDSLKVNAVNGRHKVVNEMVRYILDGKKYDQAAYLNSILREEK